MNWRLELVPHRWNTLTQGLGGQDRLPEFLPSVGLAPGQSLVVGRSMDCDILVPHIAVERRKARVWHDGEAVWLQDLGSLSGTYWQGHSHPDFAPVLRPTRLEVDDLFRVVEFVYVLTARFPVPEHWRVWSGATIPALARAIQGGQDWNALPVLADALEEAGCDNAELLHHFRDLPHQLDHCVVLTHLLDSLEAGRETRW
jgi:hypothetical protein